MINRSVALVALAASCVAGANSLGVVGYSGLQGGSCGSCHAGGGTPTVSINGPATLAAGATGNYTLVITGGPASRAGFNVAVNDANAKLNPGGGTVGMSFGELHQTSPTAMSGNTVSFPFTLTAPPFVASLRLYACGNSTNGNGAASGDGTATTTLNVTVTAGSGTLPPVITNNTFNIATPVTTRTAAVSVLANDDGSESNLSYTWSATGPAPVSFAPNGSNAAKASTATFGAEGAYMVTIRALDGTNRNATVTLPVTVSATYTAIRLTPLAVQVPLNGTQQFTASARDQFDHALATQPTFAWAVPGGGGTVSSSGLFKAQNVAGGPFVITASASSIAAGASIGVGQAVQSNDITPPTATLMAPAPGADLTAGLSLEATAIDNIGVELVEFLVADQVVGRATAPPWTVSYTPTAGLPPGAQILNARAKDLSGNYALSNSITVNVPATAADGGSGGGGPDAGGGSPGSDPSDPGGGPGVTSVVGYGCDATAAGMPLLALVIAPLLARRRRGGRPPLA